MNGIAKAICKSAMCCPRCREATVELFDPAAGAPVGQSGARCPSCGWMGYTEAKLRRCEVFEWGFDGGARTVFWDVTSMREDLARNPEEGKMFFMPRQQIEELAALNPYWPELANDSLEGIPLGEPVLIIPHPTDLVWSVPSFPFPWIVLDGWHRLYWAWKQGGPGYTALLLSKEYERKFRALDIVHVGWSGTPEVLKPERRRTVFEGMGGLV